MVELQHRGMAIGSTRSGVWLAASRRKPRPTIFPNQTVNLKGADEADGATPLAARGTRALPKSNGIVPAKPAGRADGSTRPGRVLSAFAVDFLFPPWLFYGAFSMGNADPNPEKP